ncbi:MAG: hypothetical protein ACI4I6_05585 [Hominimerdicola sp.]
MSKNKSTINPQDLSKKDLEAVYALGKLRNEKKEKRNKNFKEALKIILEYGLKVFPIITSIKKFRKF